MLDFELVSLRSLRLVTRVILLGWRLCLISLLITKWSLPFLSWSLSRCIELLVVDIAICLISMWNCISLLSQWFSRVWLHYTPDSIWLWHAWSWLNWLLTHRRRNEVQFLFIWLCKIDSVYQFLLIDWDIIGISWQLNHLLSILHKCVCWLSIYKVLFYLGWLLLISLRVQTLSIKWLLLAWYTTVERLCKCSWNVVCLVLHTCLRLDLPHTILELTHVDLPVRVGAWPFHEFAQHTHSWLCYDFTVLWTVVNRLPLFFLTVWHTSSFVHQTRF